MLWFSGDNARPCPSHTTNLTVLQYGYIIAAGRNMASLKSFSHLASFQRLTRELKLSVGLGLGAAADEHSFLFPPPCPCQQQVR